MGTKQSGRDPPPAPPPAWRRRDGSRQDRFARRAAVSGPEAGSIVTRPSRETQRAGSGGMFVTRTLARGSFASRRTLGERDAEIISTSRPFQPYQSGRAIGAPLSPWRVRMPSRRSARKASRAAASSSILVIRGRPSASQWEDASARASRNRGRRHFPVIRGHCRAQPTASRSRQGPLAAGTAADYQPARRCRGWSASPTTSRCRPPTSSWRCASSARPSSCATNCSAVRP